MIRRINLFGAPARGKSNLAAWLFAMLRFDHVKIGLVQEYVKEWALFRRPIETFDQVHFLGEQMHREYEWLKAGTDLIVTDSPLMLGVFYAPIILKRAMREIVQQYDNAYPPLNIFLTRDDQPYETEGRYQNEQEAQAVEETFHQAMYEEYGYNGFTTYRFDEKLNILSDIKYALQEQKEDEKTLTRVG